MTMQNFAALVDAWDGGVKRFWAVDVVEARDGIGFVPFEGFPSFDDAKRCARHRRKSCRVHMVVIDVLKIYDRAALLN